MAKELVMLDNTRFIFKTNLSGDPDRDESYHSSDRICNIVIPTQEQADELASRGFNVRQTKPKEGEEAGFVPTYFVKAKANYDSQYPPKIYLVSGDEEPELLNEDSVGNVDYVYVLRVNAVLSPYYSEGNHTWSLYIKTMYVEQDVENDPFAARYRR